MLTRTSELAMTCETRFAPTLVTSIGVCAFGISVARPFQVALVFVYESDRKSTAGLGRSVID